MSQGKPRIRVQALSRLVGDVVSYPGVTALDVDAGLVLSDAAGASLTDVVVLGYDADGDEYFASSMADGGSVLWLMERLKAELLRTTVDDLPPRAVDPEGLVLAFKPRGK
jgi:hypothetical protein